MAKVTTQARTIADGGAKVVVAKPPSTVDELQWTVSNSEILFNNSTYKAELKRMPTSETIENLTICYSICNTGASPICCDPVLFNLLSEIKVKCNGKDLLEYCSENEIKQIYRNKRLSSHADQKQRDHDWYVETGSSTLLDPVTGCLNCVEIPAGGCEMVHTYFDRISDLFKGMDLSRCGHIEIEFKLSSMSSKIANSPTATQDLKIQDFSVISRHKKHPMGTPSSMFSGHTLYTPRYDTQIYPPGAHPFANAGPQEFRIQLSQVFPVRNIVKILAYFNDPASPESFRCINEDGDPWTQIETTIGGNSSGCSPGQTGITSQKTYSTPRHIYDKNLQYWKRHGVELPSNPSDPGHNKAWVLNSVVTSPHDDTINHNPSKFCGDFST
jgi:hypothetical protein